MVSFDFFVQEGCVQDAMRPEIEATLKTVCADQLGQDAGPVEMSWTVIRKGFGFRGGQPSTTSLVRGRVPDGCDPETRARFLRAIGTEWCRITGATEHEVVVSARDWSWAG